MRERLKPTRTARPDRDDTPPQIHEDSHSWAVSYADFLMVLLSFFIIFFSVDGNKKTDLIDQIAAETLGAGKNKPAGYTNKSLTNTRLPSGVAEVANGVDGMFVERPDKSQKLYIYFDDNIYAPGQLDLNEAQIQNLRKILSSLQPFMDNISITFVGHTDSTAVSISRNRFIDDNFDLSSLRATKALQQAARLGFNPTKMFAKGVAEHSRGSRTLSLIIAPSEEDL
jgi:flagellar motor protein MotB